MAGRVTQTKRRKSRKPQPDNDYSRIIKGIVLLVAAAVALAAGIYKGGEGLFFGVVFAMACGLLGILYMRGSNATGNTGKR